MKSRIDQPLAKLADAAFEQASQKVIERARQFGTPIIVWENEAIKEVQPPQDRSALDRQNSGRLPGRPAQPAAGPNAE